MNFTTNQSRWKENVSLQFSVITRLIACSTVLRDKLATVSGRTQGPAWIQGIKLPREGSIAGKKLHGFCPGANLKVATFTHQNVASAEFQSILSSLMSEGHGPFRFCEMSCVWLPFWVWSQTSYESTLVLLGVPLHSAKNRQGPRSTLQL